MAAPSGVVAAALARVDDADARHDVAAITRELASLPGAELVVLRCCEALQNEENARAAAASANVLLVLLQALRDHAHCAVVVQAAWCALYVLLNHGLGRSSPVVRRQSRGSIIAKAAFEHGTLELALISVCDVIAGVKTVTASLAAFCFVATPHHVPRALQLGGVEVRFLVCNTARPKAIAHQGCGTGDTTISCRPKNTAMGVRLFRLHRGRARRRASRLRRRRRRAGCLRAACSHRRRRCGPRVLHGPLQHARAWTCVVHRRWSRRVFGCSCPSHASIRRDRPGIRVTPGGPPSQVSAHPVGGWCVAGARRPGPCR